MTARRSTHVLLLADTHLGPGQAQRLIERLPRSLARADVILHAGDIVDHSVVDALAALRAGACRAGQQRPRPATCHRRWAAQLGGCEVAMVHDSGPSTGRAARLRRWFPTADVVVFGHSHIPWHQTDSIDGHVQHHVNPGSAMQRRRQPRCTAAWLHLRSGRSWRSATSAFRAPTPERPSDGESLQISWRRCLTSWSDVGTIERMFATAEEVNTRRRPALRRPRTTHRSSLRAPQRLPRPTRRPRHRNPRDQRMARPRVPLPRTLGRTTHRTVADTRPTPRAARPARRRVAGHHRRSALRATVDRPSRRRRPDRPGAQRPRSLRHRDSRLGLATPSRVRASTPSNQLLPIRTRHLSSPSRRTDDEHRPPSPVANPARSAAGRWVVVVLLR